MMRISLLDRKIADSIDARRNARLQPNLTGSISRLRRVVSSRERGKKGRVRGTGESIVCISVRYRRGPTSLPVVPARLSVRNYRADTAGVIQLLSGAGPEAVVGL